METLPYELSIGILANAVAPFTRTKIIRRVRNLLFTCKYFNQLCYHPMFISKIIPRHIREKYPNMDVKFLLREYHEPKIIVCCSDTTTYSVTIYRIDTVKEFRYRISGQLSVPPHRAIVIYGDSVPHDSENPATLLECNKLTKVHTAGEVYAWKLIIVNSTPQMHVTDGVLVEESISVMPVSMN